MSNEPIQKLLSAPELAESITLEHLGIRWQMLPQAEYRIAARVLQSTQYDDWQAAFAPIDLALGWGIIGDPQIDKWIDWRQSDRWYYYRLHRRFGKVPLSQEYVIEHSANVHVIPANDDVAAGLHHLQANDLVFLEGMLVDVVVNDGHAIRKYSTSLTRADEGDASCEIMYVERLVTTGSEHR
ncbi:MAG: hypothetical protein IPM53_01885 [Anaerolineaceae bacterium]|nr:hypothetical protein [Anaerolineaceae bacterium]